MKSSIFFLLNKNHVRRSLLKAFLIAVLSPPHEENLHPVDGAGQSSTRDNTVILRRNQCISEQIKPSPQSSSGSNISLAVSDRDPMDFRGRPARTAGGAPGGVLRLISSTLFKSTCGKLEQTGEPTACVCFTMLLLVQCTGPTRDTHLRDVRRTK
jgi:hypothetical protein